MVCAAAAAFLAVGVVKAADPALSPAELTAIVAAVAPGQAVRTAPRPHGGFLLYGPDGRTGTLLPNGTGWTIRYGAETHQVHRNGSGWAVARGGSAPRNVRGDGSGGTTVSGGGPTLNVRSNGTGYTISSGGQSRTAVPNGGGWSISGGR